MVQKQKAQRVFKQLLLIVHPDWLEHWSDIARPREATEETIRGVYEKDKPELLPPEKREELFKMGFQIQTMDWKRYRKAMFDRYGKVILGASSRKDTLVVFIAVPMHSSEYKAVAKEDREALKTAKHKDVARLLAFAKEKLGDRLIVINTSPLNLMTDILRLQKIFQRKKITLAKGAIIRGIGETRAGCVRAAAEQMKVIFPNTRVYVSPYFSGDTLARVKARRIRHHTRINYTKQRRKERHTRRVRPK
jgi:hypothetical protein